MDKIGLLDDINPLNLMEKFQDGTFISEKLIQYLKKN